MIQHEAAERFAGGPHSRETLSSLLLKPWWQIEIAWRFRRSDFDPPPGVGASRLLGTLGSHFLRGLPGCGRLRRVVAGDLRLAHAPKRRTLVLVDARLVDVPDVTSKNRHLFKDIRLDANAVELRVGWL